MKQRAYWLDHGSNLTSELGNELLMAHSRDEPEPRRARRRRPRRRAPYDLAEPHEPGLHRALASQPVEARLEPRRGQRRAPREQTDEERVLREARSAANRKIGFMAHAICFGTTCLFLLFVAGFRVAMIVALSWGIGLVSHWFGALVAPRMRLKIIDDEVRDRLQTDVPRARRSLENEQSRRVEELSASIAHEIRNPITAAKSLVQQMGEDPGAYDNVEYANVALEELERVEKSISHLLRFAREEDIELCDVDLRDVIESAIETFRDRLAKSAVQIELETETAGAMRGDPEKLRRVVINLLSNALDAFDEVGIPEPRIHIQAGENLAGTEVWVRVKDNGPGMDAERLGKIFSPFYTSKASGTGLGLAITKKVVDAHGGSIEAHSEPGSGTEFLLTFPKAEPGAEAEETS